MVRVVVVAVVFAAALAGCPIPDEADHTPPRVLTVVPSETVVPVTVSFRFTFSEALNPKTVSDDPASDGFAGMIVRREKLNDTFLGDIKNPPLSESRFDDIEPATIALTTADTAITLTPKSPLVPGTAYAVVLSANLRDTKGNPLVDAGGVKSNFELDFVTDAGPPKVLKTDLPSGNSTLAPNRKRITVTFNQPVQNVSQDTLHIDGSPAADVDGILIDESRATATIVLADGAGCERFGAGATYTLTAEAGIIGDTLQALEPFSQTFTTGAACDTSQNVMSGVVHIDGETTATVQFTTTKPSTTEVRYGLAGGALDCLGGPCPLLGAPTTAPNAQHSASISGLTVDVDYDFVAVAEDDVGSVATSRGTIHTAPLPKIAVNEVVADAAGSGTDAQGEFIELTSFEPSLTTDLSGWSMQTSHLTSSGSVSLDDCDIPAGTSIEPGGFKVFTQSGFDASVYPGMDESTIVRISLCSLVNDANDGPYVISLFDPSGRPVSSMSVPNGVGPKDGHSVERKAPDAPDTDDSYCDASLPTPGAQNGAVSGTCD